MTRTRDATSYRAVAGPALPWVGTGLPIGRLVEMVVCARGAASRTAGALRRSARRPGPWLRAAVRAGVAASAISRRTGLGAGAVIGGRVTLALAPSASTGLSAGRQVRCVVAGGERAADLGVRLTYAGIDHSTVADPIAALALLPAGPVDVAANYTAFHHLHRSMNPGRAR